MTTKKLFPRDHLKLLASGDEPGGYCIKLNEIRDRSRWAVEYELVFSHGGQLWGTHYRRGATEEQDEGPFEYESKEITCLERRATSQVVTIYEVIP